MRRSARGEAGDELTLEAALACSLYAPQGWLVSTMGAASNAGSFAGQRLEDYLEAGQSLSPGKIYESNRTGLAALATSRQGDPQNLSAVERPAATDTQAALSKALQEYDLVIASGGVSVGEMDFIKSAFEQLGVNLQFWKVAIRPGRPFLFGRAGENPLS